MVAFTINVDEASLADLRRRIRATRWPDQIPGVGWSQGTELEYLRSLLAYWADGFDWRAQERALNAYRHELVDVGGATVHCVHERAPGGGGIPLILTHGWPSCFVELLPLIPLLTRPTAGPAFDVVIPSLPGYGYTPRPASTGVNYRSNARLWHGLMRELGYDRYGAQGGDFGAGVATYLALDYPEAVIGIQLTTPELSPYLGPGAPPLTEAERHWVDQNDRWSEVERGYSSIQSTKPQTVGYGLTDSPAGLAAWLVEKWRSWTDSGGDLDRHVGRDFLLTLLTVYWTTGSITSSMRDYFDNRFHGVRLGPDDRVRVPTAIAGFDHHFVPEGEPPREWFERIYNVRRFTRMPRGGHFAAIEAPELVATDLIEFFRDLDLS